MLTSYTYSYTQRIHQRELHALDKSKLLFQTTCTLFTLHNRKDKYFSLILLETRENINIKATHITFLYYIIENVACKYYTYLNILLYVFSTLRFHVHNCTFIVYLFIECHHKIASEPAEQEMSQRGRSVPTATHPVVAHSPSFAPPAQVCIYSEQTAQWRTVV